MKLPPEKAGLFVLARAKRGLFYLDENLGIMEYRNYAQFKILGEI